MKLKLKCLTFNIFNIVCIAASVIECSIWNHIKRKQLFVSLSSEQEALSDGDMNAVASFFFTLNRGCVADKCWIGITSARPSP